MSRGLVDDMLTHSSSACLVVSSWLIVEVTDPSVRGFPSSVMTKTNAVGKAIGYMQNSLKDRLV